MIAVLIESSLVKSAATVTDLPAGWTEVVPAGTETGGQVGTTILLRDIPALSRAHVDGGVLVPRPASPMPTVDGGTVTIPACVADTVVTIDDGIEMLIETTAPADDWTEVYSLTDAGTYRIEVAAPVPALPSVQRVTIT